MLIAYPCIEADAEERSVGNIQNGATVMRGDELLKKKSLFVFSLRTKNILVAS